MMAERVALASCMRNEGIFLLEWIAYHQGLGFDEILVVTNECTDGSDLLLDQLAALGQVTHIRQSLQAGENPQDNGMDQALAHLRQTQTPWCLHIDSDEFLLIETGQGQISDLLRIVETADVVPINWRNFGDNGLTHWTPGDTVLQSFTKAEDGPTPGTTKSKCLFRVASFARATDHNPRDPLVADPTVRSVDGAPLSNASLRQKKSSRFRPHDRACQAQNARLNHYAVKSQDLFMMKNDRGDGQGKLGEPKYHLNSNWHRAANRNDVEDRAILAQISQTASRLAALRANPEIAQAEKSCQNWFLERRAKILTEENRRAWTRTRGP